MGFQQHYLEKSERCRQKDVHSFVHSFIHSKCSLMLNAIKKKDVIKQTLTIFFLFRFILHKFISHFDRLEI